MRALAVVSELLWLSKNTDKIAPHQGLSALCKFVAQAALLFWNTPKNYVSLEKEVFLNTDCPTRELARLVTA